MFANGLNHDIIRIETFVQFLINEFVQLHEMSSSKVTYPKLDKMTYPTVDSKKSSKEGFFYILNLLPLASIKQVK